MTSRYRITYDIVAKLEEALSAATMERCAIADEHKRAMRPYVQAWIEGPLRSALRDIKREEQP